MAKSKPSNGLVGLSLMGDRIRIAAIALPNGNTHSPQSRRLSFEEFELPDFDGRFPHALPAASALAPLLKTALLRQGIASGRAAVAIGGSRLVMRYFVGTETHVRDELRQATERSINYLPFGLGDRVADDYLHELDDGRTHALLGIASAGTIDPLVKALEQVGLRVEVIEPALVALTRLAVANGQSRDGASMIVSVESDGVEIGVVLDGHVLFSRRPICAAASAPASNESRPRCDLPRELDRVARHYARAFGDSQEMRRLVLCGQQALIEPHAEALRSAGEYEFEILRLDEKVGDVLSVPETDLTGEHSCPSATGTLAGLTDSGEWVGPNLASEREVQRKSLIAVLLPTLLWPTLIAAAIWAGVHFTQGHLEQRLVQLRIEADHPSPVETKYRELRMQAARAEQRVARLEELIGAFNMRNPAPLLETIRICVADKLWLHRLRLEADDQLRIDGAAYEEKVIYRFREYLEQAPLIESATIITTSKSQDGPALLTEFSIECTVLFEPRGADLAARQ